MKKKSKGFGKPVHQNTDKYLTQFAKKMAHNSVGQSGAKLLVNPDGIVKMSEVLEEFVDPYLNSHQTGEEQKKMFSVAVFAWNLAMEPDESRRSTIQKMLAGVMANGTEQDCADMTRLLEELIARKHQYFDEVNRLIVDFQMKGNGDRFHLSVASRVV